MKTAFLLSLLFLFSQLQAATTASNAKNVSTSPATSSPSSTKNVSTSPATSSPSNTKNASTSAATTSSQMDLKSEMSTSVQKKTGVNRLNPEQLQGLQTWISDYIQKKTTSEDTVASNQVAAILSEGHYVKLGNGDVWTISPNAWIFTFYWQKGDPVAIGKSGDVLFPIELTNQNYGQSVNAQKPSKDVSTAFKQSYQITNILEDGQFIELSNGSSWEVEPSTRYMAQGWSVGSIVFVVKSSVSKGVPYQLYNGEAARSVFVDQVRAATKPSSQNKKTSISTKTQVSPTNTTSTNTQVSPTNASQNTPQEPQG